MSGQPLMLTIELQLCLVVVAAILNGLKNPRRAAVAVRDGMMPAGKPGRRP